MFSPSPFPSLSPSHLHLISITVSPPYSSRFHRRKFMDGSLLTGMMIHGIQSVDGGDEWGGADWTPLKTRSWWYVPCKVWCRAHVDLFWWWIQSGWCNRKL